MTQSIIDITGYAIGDLYAFPLGPPVWWSVIDGLVRMRFSGRAVKDGAVHSVRAVSGGWERTFDVATAAMAAGDTYTVTVEMELVLAGRRT